MQVNGNLKFSVLGSGELQNAIIERLATAPTGAAGRIYYDTTTNFYYYYDGTAWQQFSAGASSVSTFSAGTTGFTPSSATSGAITLAGTLNAAHGGTGQNTYTAGDTLYASGATALSKLPAGTATQVLHSGATPSWSAVSLTADVTGVLPLANGGTNANLSAVAGGIVYSGGSALAISAAGTTGQFVLSGGTGAPTFLTNSTPIVDDVGSTVLVVGTSFSFLGTANQITTTGTSGVVTMSLPSTLIAPGTVEVTSDLTVDGLTYESAQTNITAHAGGGQGSAFQLTKNYNVITVVATSGDSVKLPASGVGLDITVVNFGANSLNVFPSSGDQIDGGSVNAAVPIPAGGTATYQSVNAGNWYTIDPVITTSGVGISVTYSPGQTVLANTGVTSFQTSLTGLTPSGSTAGAITLAGTLGVASGGTGDTTLTLNGVLFGNGTSPVQATAAGSQYNVLTVNGSSVPVFGQVNLAQAAAVTGILGLTNGGTNASLTAVAGAPVYSTASALAVGTAGSTGQAYISGGTGAPTWQNVSSSITAGEILKGDGSGAFTAVGGTFTGSGSFSGVTLNGTVTNATDAVTKAYVDAIAAGLTWKNAVMAIAVTNFALTGGATLTIDGYSVQNGDRVLLAGQTTGTQNGIYVASGIGTAYVLTRSTDMATGSNADNAAVFVENGTVYANSGWVETASPAIVGTNALTFAQFSGGSVYSFTSGLQTTGSTISVRTDGTTTYIDGSNNVAVKSSATANQVLLSNGTSTTPTWGALPLGDNNAVTGTLAVPHGGTGDTSFTIHGVVVGNSTNPLSVTAAGSTGDVLTGNTSADPTFVALNTLAVTSLSGTANQITASASVGSVTLSLPSTLIAPGSLEVTTTTKFDGLVYESTAAVSAAGVTQGTATAITAEYNLVTASAGNTGVKLPTPAYAGVAIKVVNVSAVDAKVYPATGGAIDGAGTNASITVPAGGTWTGQASTTTQWYSIDPVVVNGTGISVTYSNGQTSISNTGVLAFSAGSTGLTPNTLTSGNVTLAGTLIAVNGGTGFNTYAVGDLLYADTTTTLAKLAAGTSTQVLHGGSTPSWSAVSLTADVSGILPSANGGTGVDNSTGAVGKALIATSTGNFTATPIQFVYDSTLHGGPATSFTVTHSLGQRYVNVTVYDNAWNQIIPQSVVLTSTTVTTVTVNSAIDVYVVVMGVAGVALA